MPLSSPYTRTHSMAHKDRAQYWMNSLRLVRRSPEWMWRCCSTQQYTNHYHYLTGVRIILQKPSKWTVMSCFVYVFSVMYSPSLSLSLLCVCACVSFRLSRVRLRIVIPAMGSFDGLALSMLLPGICCSHTRRTVMCWTADRAANFINTRWTIWTND